MSELLTVMDNFSKICGYSADVPGKSYRQATDTPTLDKLEPGLVMGWWCGFGLE